MAAKKAKLTELKALLTNQQINLARENARQHGFIEYVTDENAILFLNWCEANKLEIESKPTVYKAYEDHLEIESTEYWRVHLRF